MKIITRNRISDLPQSASEQFSADTDVALEDIFEIHWQSEYTCESEKHI